MNQELWTSVERYLTDTLVHPDQSLNEAVAANTRAGLPAIDVSPNEGKLLHLLARIQGAKRILEIGTLGGYSTIWMARALPENGRLISLEVDPLHASVARKNIERAGLSSKVEVRVGKAIEILPELQGPFDMIFIDADKPPYAEYFQWALRLSRPGTLIIADNVVREGRVLNPSDTDERVQGVRRFNQLLSETKEVSATIMQTVGAKEYDGMAIAVVKDLP